LSWGRLVYQSDPLCARFAILLILIKEQPPRLLAKAWALGYVEGHIFMAQDQFQGVMQNEYRAVP